MIGDDCVCTLWFLRPECSESTVPSRVFVLLSPLELIIILGAAPLIFVPCQQPGLGVQYQPWSIVDIRGTASLPHSMSIEQRWGHLRANLGFGVFWFISPLLVVAYLPPTSFILRIFSGLSVVGDLLHQLVGVRVEKSAGRILVRNHIHSPYSGTGVV